MISVQCRGWKRRLSVILHCFREQIQLMCDYQYRSSTNDVKKLGSAFEMKLAMARQQRYGEMDALPERQTNVVVYVLELVCVNE